MVICKYYAILYKGFEHPWILVFLGDPGNNPPQKLRDDCRTENIYDKNLNTHIDTYTEHMPEGIKELEDPTASREVNPARATTFTPESNCQALRGS